MIAGNSDMQVMRLKKWWFNFQAAVTVGFLFFFSTLSLAQDVVRLDEETSSVDQKAKAVLSYIKTEAAKNAKISLENVKNRSVEGSNFLYRLEKHYFNRYWRNKSVSEKKELIHEIGKPARFLWFTKKQRIFVPLNFRKQYEHKVPKYLNVATNILLKIDTPKEGRPFFRSGKTVIDVPFLIGERNYGSNETSDWQNGGKNWSNVMHWATGLKYSELPDSALQELFVAYEYWHMEGFDVFGEDAINDLISEEQGRLFGKALRSESLETHSELIRVMDAAFHQSRRWVGALLSIRQKKLTKTGEKPLDSLILSKEFVPTDKWLKGTELSVVRPWSTEKHAKTIRQMLESGKSTSEVEATPLVRRLIAIYQLIYEADEWSKQNGEIEISPLIRKILNGDYDKQFKAAKKGYKDQWIWIP
jgi:hypothetical protein